jgi:hypothetical protein
MDEYVLCKDCKHAKWRPWWLLSYRCYKTLLPAETKIDLVEGPSTKQARYDSCFSQRLSSGACGKAGKFWEPKNKKDLFKFIKHTEKVQCR